MNRLIMAKISKMYILHACIKYSTLYMHVYNTVHCTWLLTKDETGETTVMF